MDSLEYRKVQKIAGGVDVFNLVDTVLQDLERKEFFIPYTKQERERFFDDNFAPLYGAYDNNKLVAINQLFIDEEMVEDYYAILSIEKSKSICELGGFLVLKEYWNKGIMTSLSNIQYNLAKELQFDYIVATVHPDNIASCKVIEKLGLELFDTITTNSGYLRNLYYKNLKIQLTL